MPITEKEAREATRFEVEYCEDDHIPIFDFNDYRKACTFARSRVRAYGTVYVMPIIDGRRAGQWVYSEYPRYFES